MEEKETAAEGGFDATTNLEGEDDHGSYGGRFHSRCADGFAFVGVDDDDGETTNAGGDDKGIVDGAFFGLKDRFDDATNREDWSE